MRSEYFIALVADGVAHNPVAHRRRDIDPDEIIVTGTETAGRTIITVVTDVDDPGLAGARAGSWCHVSRELADGSLFHVGQGWIDPISIQSQDEDLVSFDIVCSPRDYIGACAPVLAPLQILPGFDVLLVKPEAIDDPVEILDGYTLSLHCHPSTHAITLVDIFGVGLPVVEIDDPDFPGPQADATARPIDRVDVIVTTEFIERRQGTFVCGNTIESEFPEDRANTLTPDAFEASFPKIDSVINGDSGYVVKRSILTRREDLDVELFPIEAGPVRGSSGVYNYVTDPDLESPEPQEIMLERAWYDLELDIQWTVAQKRVQTARFSISNGSSIARGGSVETLDLKTNDVSVDTITPEWEPGVLYDVDDIRRVGTRNWRCLREHVSAVSFGADLNYSLGGGLGYGSNWALEPTTNSPLGSTDARTYFHSARGRQTLKAAALKARAMLAASIRNRPYRFETELTDELLTLTTGHVVKVRCDDQPSGWLQGKVTELEISSNADDEVLSITISPAAGSGIVVAGADPLSQTGADWDRIYLGDIDDQQPEILPAVGGTVRIENKVADQLAHVGANDYLPSAGRADAKANDPLELLKAVPTEVVLSLTQISGREPIVQEIDVPIAAPWSGPKQQGV